MTGSAFFRDGGEQVRVEHVEKKVVERMEWMIVGLYIQRSWYRVLDGGSIGLFSRPLSKLKMPVDVPDLNLHALSIE